MTAPALRGLVLQKAIPAAVLVVGAAILAACVPSLSVEQARRITAEFEGQAFTPPPRTITDLVRTLDAIRPDPAGLASTHAAADAPPPVGADAAALADFHHRRAGAAGRV